MAPLEQPADTTQPETPVATPVASAVPQEAIPEPEAPPVLDDEVIEAPAVEPDTLLLDDVYEEAAAAEARAGFDLYRTQLNWRRRSA